MTYQAPLADIGFALRHAASLDAAPAGTRCAANAGNLRYAKWNTSLNEKICMSCFSNKIASARWEYRETCPLRGATYHQRSPSSTKFAGCISVENRMAPSAANNPLISATILSGNGACSMTSKQVINSKGPCGSAENTEKGS